MSKLTIYFSPKTSTQVKQSVREILGIIEQSSAMHYLGIPISGHHLWRADCTKLVASICTCLEGWKSRMLLIMGRATLVKLVLSAILIFLLSSTIIPRATLSRLEQLFWNFL